jgi:hypothetical protein
MTGGRVHTVYTVTVKHPESTALTRYVIAAPTPQHAVTAVERSTGGRAYVWQVDAPVSGEQWQRGVTA